MRNFIVNKRKTLEKNMSFFFSDSVRTLLIFRKILLLCRFLFKFFTLKILSYLFRLRLFSVFLNETFVSNVHMYFIHNELHLCLLNRMFRSNGKKLLSLSFLSLKDCWQFISIYIWRNAIYPNKYIKSFNDKGKLLSLFKI